MIITFWDKTSIHVSREHWEQIKHMRDVEGKERIELPAIYSLREFHVNSIAKVTEGGEPPVPKDRRIEAPAPPKFNPNSPGYKSFLAARKQLSKKLGARP